MGTYLDDLWNDLEQTWDLAMAVNDLSESERGDVAAAWEKHFKGSDLVDVGKTEAEGQTPPMKVFCKNIYENPVQHRDQVLGAIPARRDRSRQIHRGLSSKDYFGPARIGWIGAPDRGLARDMLNPAVNLGDSGDGNGTHGETGQDDNRRTLATRLLHGVFRSRHVQLRS